MSGRCWTQETKGLEEEEEKEIEGTQKKRSLSFSWFTVSLLLLAAVAVDPTGCHMADMADELRD